MGLAISRALIEARPAETNVGLSKNTGTGISVHLPYHSFYEHSTLYFYRR